MTSTNEMSKKILVTNALPYANNSIHIGHLVGYIQADIWVRYQKMKERDELFKRLPGNNCSVCGAPDCITFAEDIVIGRAKLADCIFLEK